MTRDDAARTARANMGSVAAIKDHTRDAGWESTIEGFWQDVRYAARALLRAPGFSLTVFATLAIAIGGNTAIFQLADAVRLRPLPVEPRSHRRSADDASGARADGTVLRPAAVVHVCAVG
jgi:hypothetical protein